LLEDALAALASFASVRRRSVEYVKNHLWAQFALVAVTLLVIFFGWQLAILHKAHRTFDNYAAFRGCAAITSRTETSGTCTLGSGRSIKIVRFNDRWFLEGVCRCCAWAEFVCNRTDDDYPSRKAVASAELRKLSSASQNDRLWNRGGAFRVSLAACAPEWSANAAGTDHGDGSTCQLF